MQAVILAGGLGTRLWPLTKEVPKPMVTVAGAPYLEHQLRYLAGQYIVNIVLLTGYLGEQIEQYFGDGSRFGLAIQYSQEAAPAGTGGALRHAELLLKTEFLVIYGDSFLPIQYGDVLARLAATRAEGVITAYDNALAHTSVKNNIALDSEGFVVRYDKEGGDEELGYVEAGVLALRRSVIQRLPAGVVSLENEIFPRLIAKRRLAAYTTRQRFYDIGTPDRLASIEEFFRK